jgi:hypothetical protein
MVTRPKELKEIEIEPDAWARFERAIDVVAKSPPQHKIRADKASKKKKSAKPRPTGG